MALFVLLVVLACLLVVIAVMFRISAALLRISVSITNGILGGRDVEESDFRRGASAYDLVPRPASLGGLRIPMPGVFYAILINIMSGIASVAAQIAAIAGVVMLGAVAIDFTADPGSPEWVKLQLLSWAVGTPVGLLVSLVVLKMALPTTFPRAALVAFCQFVLTTLLCCAIGVGMVLISGASFDDMPTKAPRGGNVWFK